MNISRAPVCLFYGSRVVLALADHRSTLVTKHALEKWIIFDTDEDGEHDNAMIWYYDLTKSGKDALTRVATAPAGAEWTSGYFYPNINGYAYILDVVQHPDDQVRCHLGACLPSLLSTCCCLAGCAARQCAVRLRGMQRTAGCEDL